jgi:hypothetical protein
MMRFSALFVTLVVFSIALAPDSVSAQSTHGASSSGVCRLHRPLMEVHALVLQLGQEVGDADETVHRLRHTTRWRPYKHVERAWRDVQNHGSRALDVLSDIPVALDFTADSDEKKAVLDLVSSYQNAVEHLLDYAHTVAYYERTQTSLTTYMWRRQYLSFGVESDPNRARTDDIARYQLDESATEATVAFMDRRPLRRLSASPWASPTGGLLDALLAVKIQEHHYAMLCRAPLSTPIITAAMTAMR